MVLILANVILELRDVLLVQLALGRRWVKEIGLLDVLRSWIMLLHTKKAFLAVYKVAFVANECNDDLSVRIFTYFIEPVLQVQETLAICDIVD